MKLEEIQRKVDIGTKESGKCLGFQKTNINILVGKSGTGKSKYIAKIIKHFNGKCILIDSKDSREYLGLEDIMTVLNAEDIENIENIKDFKKILILCEDMEKLEEDKKMKLEWFILRNMIDISVMTIVDESVNIMPKFIFSIFDKFWHSHKAGMVIKQEKENYLAENQGSNIFLVMQSLEQLEKVIETQILCCDKNGVKRVENIDCSCECEIYKADFYPRYFYDIYKDIETRLDQIML